MTHPHTLSNVVEVGSRDDSAAEPASTKGLETDRVATEELHDTVVVPVAVHERTDEAARRFSFRRLVQFAGPGLLMSIAYVDPGNLEADLQTGATEGYALGWLVLWSTVLGFFVQLLAVRLGVVTRKHLAQHCRLMYPRVPRVMLWLAMETAIIGSDIQEVVGSAIAIQLLSGGAVPIWAGVLITGVDTFVLLLLERLGVRKLEAFFGVLVATMAAAFGVIYVRADCPQLEVLRGVAQPRLKASQITTAAGMLGALVMPHNIYLHSALVQSRKLDTEAGTGTPSSKSPGAHRAAKKEAILYHCVEGAASLVVAVFINLCVMFVFAKTFHGTPAAEDAGLSRAGELLGEKFGPVMKYIWALGLFAAGQSSTMTGTYTGQFVMGGFFDWHLAPWQRALITRAAALVPTLTVAILFAGSSRLDVLNQDLNVLQSFVLPFSLLPVLYMTSRADIMGPFRSRRAFNAFVHFIGALLLVVNLATAALVVRAGLQQSAVGGAFAVAALALYFAFVLYLMIGPSRVHALLARLDTPAAWWAAGWLAQQGAIEATAPKA